MSTDSDRTSLAALTLGALGVVFGDIGTSPLYAFKTCFSAVPDLQPTPENVLGLLSLIFWALIAVISLKYVTVVLRADNRGEGGVLALTTLVLSGRPPIPRALIMALGLFGAVLFFGDGAITPAISVLSAVEGLEVVSREFERYVLPLAVVILLVLFSLQKRGTGAVGSLFGPVMVVWFVTLAVLGVSWIVREPSVLAALSPLYALHFFGGHYSVALLVLSAIFLAVTGGEALYADMGHFGRRPIEFGWYLLVFPALVLNYLGQGALVLSHPEAVRSPFFLLAPEWALVPLIVLAGAATVIASQAVISGVFSVVRQSLQLGFLPRMRIIHASEETIGQVYIPSANWLLLFATLGLVLAFETSADLAAAYGIAISLAMSIDSLLVFIWLSYSGRRRARLGQALLVLVLVVDLGFVTANSVKIPHGGWLPLVAGAAMYLLMATWQQGRNLLMNSLVRQQMPLRRFLKSLERPDLSRAPGTAVYLENNPDGIPRALLKNLQVNNVVHQRVILVTVVTEDVPRTVKGHRTRISELAPGVYRVIARTGFMETPHVPNLLREAGQQGLAYRPEETTYFLGRENVVVTRRSGLPLWRKRIYALLSRNAELASQHFALPPGRVIEVGEQFEI
ncbi:MAG: potassium transporter Kup [Steroidobacteraceae bacterium]